MGVASLTLANVSLKRIEGCSLNPARYFEYLSVVTWGPSTKQVLQTRLSDRSDATQCTLVSFSHNLAWFFLEFCLEALSVVWGAIQ